MIGSPLDSPRYLETHQEGMIDLHGLSVENAEICVFQRVKDFHEKGISSILIISGRGNHIANDGVRGKICQQTAAWLDSEELKQYIESVQVNDGSYKVQLKKNPKLANVNTVSQTVRGLFESFAKDLNLSELTLSAKSSPKSLGFLGYLYFSGTNVEQNIPKGMTMIRDAAQKGDACSQLFLGDAHAVGIPGFAKQSPTKAMEWYEKVIVQNGKDAREARFRMGVAYQIGEGAYQNDEKAIGNLTLAAEDGHPLAQLNLGNIYAEGIVGKKKVLFKDDELANKWYLAAAKQNIIEAQLKLSERLLNGLGVPKKDEKEAFSWRIKAADLGDVESMLAVGACYEGGMGTDQNINLAYQYYHNALDAGHLGAKVRCAYILLKGDDFSDALMGLVWLKSSIQEDNNPEGMFLMALLQKEGGTLAFYDEKAAIQNLERSAKLGYPPALKLIFREDLETNIPEKEIIKSIVTLAKAGDKEAALLFATVLDMQGQKQKAQIFYKLANNEPISTLKNSQPTIRNKGKEADVPKPVMNSESAYTASQSSKPITTQFTNSKRKPAKKGASSVAQVEKGMASMTLGPSNINELKNPKKAKKSTQSSKPKGK